MSAEKPAQTRGRMALMHRLILGRLAEDWRQGRNGLAVLVYFAAIVSLVPLGLGPDAALLQTMAPAITWIALLLAAVIATGGLFTGGFATGQLEQEVMRAPDAETVFIAHILAAWVLQGLPLALCAPLALLLLQVPPSSLPAVALLFVIGSAIVFLIGGMIAGIALGAATSGARSAALLTILGLPLQIPALIFGAGATQNALDGQDFSAPLMLMTALLAAGLPLAAWTGGAAIRSAIEAG